MHSVSSFYSGMVGLAPKLGLQSQLFISKFVGLFALLLISSNDLGCNFDVES